MSGHPGTTPQAISGVVLDPHQRSLLLELAAMPGADVWDRPDAYLCRQLEPLGLVRIVKARGAPANGALRQPYFGVKITAAGRRALIAHAKALGPSALLDAERQPEPREDLIQSPPKEG